MALCGALVGLIGMGLFTLSLCILLVGFFADVMEAEQVLGLVVVGDVGFGFILIYLIMPGVCA